MKDDIFDMFNTTVFLNLFENKACSICKKAFIDYKNYDTKLALRNFVNILLKLQTLLIQQLSALALITFLSREYDYEKSFKYVDH